MKKRKKISKRTRENAALICSIAASNNVAYAAIAHDLGLVGDEHVDAYYLAMAAWNHCWAELWATGTENHAAGRYLGGFDTPQAYELEAEAAELLEDGWVPEGWE